MVRRVALCVGLLISTPALAQTSTTNCTVIGSQLWCNHRPATPQPQAPAFDPGAAVRQGYDFAEQMRRDREQRNAPIYTPPAEPEPTRETPEWALLGIKALMDFGECEDAVKMALRYGEAELATTVGKVCTPR